MKTSRQPRFLLILSILLMVTLGGILSACSAGQTGASSSPSASVSVSPTPSASVPSSPDPSSSVPASNTPDTAGTSVVYQNKDYGFDFKLPQSWQGYTIETDVWQGTAIGDASKIVATGPELMIRNPKWTTNDPTQDIPIMIFTLDQWNGVIGEDYVLSAAPVPPSELGRNSKYVFALPARYNFSYPTGYEDVEDILSGNPLLPNEHFK